MWLNLYTLDTVWHVIRISYTTVLPASICAVDALPDEVAECPSKPFIRELVTLDILRETAS